MVFFTLKLIRFVGRLLLKILRLPLTLLRLVAGRSGSTDDDFDFDPEPTGTETAATAATTTGTSSRDTAPAMGNAVQNLTWFRWGLYGLGALQVLVAVGGLGLAALDGGVLAQNAAVLFGGVFLVALVLAALPIGLAAALPRAPTKAWYASMGYLGLQGAAALVTGVGAIFWIAIAGVLGYLGYTGRPALRTYRLEESTRKTAPSSEQSTDTLDPATSVARADDTADEPSVDRESPATSAETSTPAPSTPDTPEDATPSADAETDHTEPATADSTGAEDEAATDTADATDIPAETTGDATDTGDALDAYRDALTDPDADVRADAVRDVAAAAADGSVPDQTVVDALADRIDDENPTVRAAACEALGDLGVPDSRPLLEDRRIDPDPDVSRAASRALRNID